MKTKSYFCLCEWQYRPVNGTEELQNPFIAGRLKNYLYHMIDKSQIVEKLQLAKSSLQKRYGFKSLALFGSHTSDTTGGNDEAIEVMVEFSDQVGMRIIDLEDELQKILGHKVDLVARKSLNPKYFKTLKPDMIYI